MAVYILLILAAIGLIYSVYLTVAIFRCFSDTVDDKDPKAMLVKYRNKMIVSYVLTVLLITAAAAVKLITG